MRDRVSILVFIDALGWELLRGRPFLEGLAADRRPLDTVFGYSSTCDPTILTGLPPREHGHFSFYVYDPARSPFKALAPLGLLPRALADRGRVRHRLSRLVAAAYGYTGYFQLYAVPFDKLGSLDYTEKRDIYAPDGINGGQESLFVRLGREGVPFYLSDWRKGEAAALAGARRALEEGRVRLLYVYLAAMDAVLHAEGTASRRAAAMVEGYDRALRGLLELARRRYGEARLFVFSDHGMADVRSLCDLMPLVEGTGLRWGRDYAAVYDSTMARFWFLAPGAEGRIREALARERRGRFLDEATLAAWGVDFPGRRYGDAFFLLDPGVLLCPSHMGRSPLAGMHGYDPGHADSAASFVSTVALARPPAGLADLHRLALEELAP